MTGFLHRLAERATGAAHPVRKAATNLFASPLLEEVPPQTDAILPGRVDPAAVSAPAAPGLTKSAPYGQLRSHIVSSKAAQPDAAPNKEAVNPVKTDRRPAASEEFRDTPISHPASEPPPLMPRASIIVQSAFSEAAPRPGSTLPQQDYLNAEPAESMLPVGSAKARVEPLLPLRQPAANPAGLTMNASRADTRYASAGLVEETTEVHVSIGRIEVTAVHEPAPAKPAASRRNAPMSLDDYLAKRHGGRP
jgi:hypothetical protein